MTDSKASINNTEHNSKPGYGSNITADSQIIQQPKQYNNSKQPQILSVINLPFFTFIFSHRKINQTKIQINGYLAYKNGTPIQTGYNFSVSQLNNYLPKYFNISQETRIINLIKNIQIFEQEQISEGRIAEEVTCIVNQAQQKINNILTIIGVCKRISVIRRKLKYYKLLTNCKIRQILNHSEQECCIEELNQEKVCQPDMFVSCIEQVQSISYKNKQNCQGNSVLKNADDYSSVDRLKTNVVKFNGQIMKEDLAVKSASKDQRQQSIKNVQKIMYEKNILEQVRQSKYLLKYYTIKDNQHQLWMEYVPETLRAKLIKRELSISEKVEIMKQITDGIRELHSQGIVHRDLKPSNILIKEEKNQDNMTKFTAKIIDFGESIQCWKYLNKTIFDQNKFQKLGSTPPYSPIQASLLCPQGYSKLKIDNWSIGMLLSEMMLNKLPVCYTKCQKQNIRMGWIGSDFSFLMNLRTRRPTDFISFAGKVVALHLMKFRYQERLCLKPVSQALQFLAVFNFNYLLISK